MHPSDKLTANRDAVETSSFPKNILQITPLCDKVSVNSRICVIFIRELREGEDRRLIMEPIMCPYCGGTNLYQDDDYSLELDFEFWTIHHWDCMECAQSFDKIEILPASNAFEEINESTIH